jgi:hypothetical protein
MSRFTVVHYQKALGKNGNGCILVCMKKLLFILLLLPFCAGAQFVSNALPPKISILRVALTKDTLFVYRHIQWPPNIMSVSQEWSVYNDREVYVVGRGKEIVLVAVERAKIRKVKADAEEEYW